MKLVDLKNYIQYIWGMTRKFESIFVSMELPYSTTFYPKVLGMNYVFDARKIHFLKILSQICFKNDVL
jgi:hypothetical protein